MVAVGIETNRRRRPRAPAKRDSLSYIDIYRATPVERVQMIKRGIPASAAKGMIADLDIAVGAAFSALKLSPATVNRKAARREPLSSDEGERVVGMARLIGQVEAMVQESGDPRGFDAAAWISRWLKEPLPAFGGERPIDLMDTMEGQAMVANALARAQGGAYA